MKKDLPPPKQPSAEPDLQVKLKPIFGIKPGIYLLVLYSIILMGAFFLFFVKPGMDRPGTYYTLTSEPSGAAVYFNKQYKGVTPLEVFLPQGSGLLTISRPRFTSVDEEIAVPGRLLFSIIFPAKETKHLILKNPVIEGILSDADTEVQAWGTTTPSQTEYPYPALFFGNLREAENWVGVKYPLPPVYSQLARDLKAAGQNDDQIKKELINRMAWTADPELYKDLCKALGFNIETADFSSQLKFWQELIPGETALAPWILINQGYQKRHETQRSAEFQNAYLKWKEGLARQPKKLGTSSGVMTLGDLEFVSIAGGEFLLGPGEISLEPPFSGGRRVNVENFYLGKKEINNRQFAQFLTAKPEWRADQKAELIRRGLVDDRYLDGWTGSTFPQGRGEFPVTGVSAWAAQAFAFWVQEKNPGWKITLPEETQWEWAAQQGSSSQWKGENLRREIGAVGSVPQDSQGIYGLMGNVWEWTATAPAPAGDLFEPVNLAAPDQARILKGGSAADSKILPWTTRGYHKTEWSGPWIGFRLAASRK